MQLTLQGLGHAFGPNPPLFRDLNEELFSNEIVGVIGPSGTGKSTLLAIIAGWIDPSFGRILGAQGSKISWAFQNPIGSPRRLAIDHVALPLLAKGMDRASSTQRAQDIMANFNIAHVAGRPFSELSGGEAQRLMLARATAVEPDILLVDEPTAQLDRTSAQAVSDVLSHVAESGSIVVIATHDPAVQDQCSKLIQLGDFQ